MRPGLKQRPGYIKQHSTADSTNGVLSMFQFSKGKRTERHFYAQMGDGDVLEATTNPPGVTTGAFGSEVFSGSSGQIPASWSVLDDQMIYSNGVDQHQICAGTANYLTHFAVYNSNTKLPDMPTVGYDYTPQVSDANESTVAILSGLGNFVSTTGTVAPVSGSRDLIGTDTLFLTELTVGQPIFISGYQKNVIESISSNTAAVVTTAFTATMELLTLDVAPATAWAAGDTITGVTSTQTCVITQKLSDLTYEVRSRNGAFELGEVLTNGTYTADQGAANPVFASTVTITTSNDCLLICTPIMPNRLTFSVPNGNVIPSNSSASYSTSAGWKCLTITDGTILNATKTLSGSGSMTWTQPTDAVPKYMYDRNGFWVKISFSTLLEGADVDVHVGSATYGSGLVPIQDVWDGSLMEAIEAQLYRTAQATYYTYGTTSISLAYMNANDYCYFNTSDPIIAAYMDTSGTPNSTASTTIDSFEYMKPDGTWATVGTFTDGTAGLSKSGFVTFPRQTDIVPMQFNSLVYSSYWYRFTVDKTLTSTTNIGITVVPYFDVSSFGVGLCNATWKDKTIYVFDQDPSWMYLSAPNAPQVLSSVNSAIFQAGDGRSNKIVCMKPFYNELLICQEEKGASGGCITLLQGTEPQNLGKIQVSNFYGAMNSQSMEVVETEEGGHNAFILSKRGILVTNGKTVNFVPNLDKVKNYFDPSNSSCIRSGYEAKMYLRHDSSYNILKIGLTTGSSATNNNTFLVYDLITKEFTVDVYANNFQCECECDAASGNVPVVQLAGGQADGTVYVLNSGLNDISTAVSSYVTVELNNNGAVIRDEEMIIRAKTQSAGAMTVTPYYNGNIQSALVRSLALTPLITNERIRRHRIPLNFKDQNVSVKLAHGTVSESFYLLDWAAKIEEYSEQ